jgi:Ner family transcriptional regulator
MDYTRSDKKASLHDWHNADIVAALRKAGWSLRKLSLHHGLYPGTLKNALHFPYPKGERHIAEAIGISTWVIWPSRYDISIDADGNTIGVPNRGASGRKADDKYHTRFDVENLGNGATAK